MDYPRNLVVPTHINSWMNAGGGPMQALINGVRTVGTNSWATASSAVFLPFYLPWPYDVRRMFWVNGNSPSGNTDIGIYTPSGVQLWHSGSVVVSGPGLQYVSVSPDILLTPGWHYIAYASSSTPFAGNAITANTGRMMGLYQQASALPLPAQATFAQYAGVGYPLIGITNTASGF